MQLGNGRWESTQFNNRLQPTQIALGATQNATNLLKLDFTYNTPNAADNNGNVKTQIITVPAAGTAPAFTATQTYNYDSLNRLKDASETIGGNQTWKQTYKYDRFGNREFDAANTTTLGSCPQTICNPSISTTNNRFNAGQGYSYDNAGNLKTDAEGKQFTYDADNKQTEVKNQYSQSIGTYFYDADGKRVKKYVPSTGETTIFVYDASGMPVAEYSTVVETGLNAKVGYLTNDNLGSPRIVTDRNGNVSSRRDFLPFGEEIGVNTAQTAGRNSNTQYTGDNVREKFATYERDSEADLDFAQARYYNFKHGRFTSVDPLMASADVVNPQTFNRYAYVGNNPVNINDPTGEIWGSKDGTVQWFDTEGAMKAAGFAGYTLLYAYRAGTNQMVALNANTNVAVNVASAAAWLSQQVFWGATAEMLAPGAAALAGVPVAVAALALGDALDPAGRWRTGMNMPEPAREWAGTKQNYWNDFMTAVDKRSQYMMNENASEKAAEQSTNPENNKPEYKKPKSNISGKEGSKDKPSWVNDRPLVGQSGKDFAKEQMDKKYGNGK